MHPTGGAMATGGATGDAVGSVQSGQVVAHTHSISDPGHAHSLNVDTTGGWDGSNVQGSNRTVNSWPGTNTNETGITGTLSTGGSETRPVNAYVSFIIKY